MPTEGKETGIVPAYDYSKELSPEGETLKGLKERENDKN